MKRSKIDSKKATKKRAPKKISGKRAINNARIAAAKGRAKEIFAEYSSDSDSEEVKGLKQELQQLRAKVQSLTPPDNPGMCTHL